MKPCTVLIGAQEILPALKERVSGVVGELLSFTDADALIALEVITKRRPKVVALEREFAATPRGMALINRIKADAALDYAEIRVIQRDGENHEVVARAHGAAADQDTAGGTVAAAAPAAALAGAAPRPKGNPPAAPGPGFGQGRA